ncbi:MAG: NADH:flavin oxidoreductase [Sphingomonadales bacterium]|nr:NADH:flavin oxidoreductase [Sphingomonadales bacterium]MBU3993176.1 FAD-dependent oxidoreductase [Alphaproteobacteria bacterium]
MTAFPNLFSPFRIRDVELPNRVVMAPMSTELGGVHGEVTPEMIAFYTERAKGGFGLIIVEYTCVDVTTGRAHEYQLTLDSRENLEGHRQLVDSVHAAGAKIFMQMQHSGQYANARLLPDGMPVGPCDAFHPRDPSRQIARAATDAEIRSWIDAFATTAGLAMEAGYDGVEMHAAHGYLLLQFLSPRSNHRDDAWGGDEARRLAFPLAVIRSIRKAIGDAPFLFRISADEFREGGLTIEDMERIAPLMVEAGVDGLHCSMGWGTGRGMEQVLEPMNVAEGWRIPYAERIRKATGVPVIAVGQIRWPQMAEDAVASGQTDLVALGRPSLADPEWPNKAREGRVDDIRPCTSCNYCLGGQAGRHQVGCAENPRTGDELNPGISPDIGKGRTAAVIGGGPGGMAAALLLDQAGFTTHLFEAAPRLGGGLVVSATPPGKDKLFWYRDYLERRINKSGVHQHLGTAADVGAIKALAPAVTMVAAGTARRDMDIPGIEGPNVLDAFALLNGDVTPDLAPGKSAIVYGGGETGCETAEYLADHGVKVTLVSRSLAKQLARAAEGIYRGALIARLAENPLVDVVAETHVTRVDGNAVELEGPEGTSRLTPDWLFVAQGRDSNRGLADKLEAAGISCTLVGDAMTGGRIGDAVHGAYRAVLAMADPATPPLPVAC